MIDRPDNGHSSAAGSVTFTPATSGKRVARFLPSMASARSFYLRRSSTSMHQHSTASAMRVMASMAHSDVMAERFFTLSSRSTPLNFVAC